MVTANPASPEADLQSRSQNEPNSPEMTNTKTGVEPKMAPLVGSSSTMPDDVTRPDGGGSSASHLAGLSAADIKTIDDKFQQLLKTVHENRPGDDLEIIRKAWEFCLQQHEGQKRASGEPYVIHPLEVGQVLAELKMDSTAIAAGLLHDAVEDTDVTSPIAKTTRLRTFARCCWRW
jgi:guanosine-3',5'-bis(diphosphate) 3'-pyrophosphohydrolase